MVLFESMYQVLAYIALTVLLMIWIILRCSPVMAGGLVLRKIVHNKKYGLHLLAVIAILFFNKIELWVEKRMAGINDFTSEIFKFEGNLVSYVQTFFKHDIVTIVLTYFYVVIFPALILASFIIYTYLKKERLFYALCYALMINYLVAIPFYLFFPVNEVWFYNPNVKFLIPDVFPSFETVYRPLSGLNNSFPSLHTSISVTLAFIAAKSTHVLWRRFVLISAATIIFSIFYLGVHWISDMLGGMLLGLFAAQLGMFISEGKPLLSKNTAVSLQEK